jgi:hypothetical protein
MSAINKNKVSTTLLSRRADLQATADVARSPLHMRLFFILGKGVESGEVVTHGERCVQTGLSNTVWEGRRVHLVIYLQQVIMHNRALSASYFASPF